MSEGELFKLYDKVTRKTVSTEKAERFVEQVQVQEKKQETAQQLDTSTLALVNKEHLAETYRSFRETVDTVLAHARNVESQDKSGVIEELRRTMEQTDAQFTQILAGLDRILPFLEKAVANADLENETLTNLNRLCKRELNK